MSLHWLENFHMMGLSSCQGSLKTILNPFSRVAIINDHSKKMLMNQPANKDVGGGHHHHHHHRGLSLLAVVAVLMIAVAVNMVTTTTTTTTTFTSKSTTSSNSSNNSSSSPSRHANTITIPTPATTPSSYHSSTCGRKLPVRRSL